MQFASGLAFSVRKPSVALARTFCRCAAFVVHLLLLPTTANKYTTAMASAKETKHEEDATAGASGGAGAGPTAGERPAAQTEVLTWGCGNDGQLGLGREWVGRSAMLPQVVPTFSQHGITITKVRYSGAELAGACAHQTCGPGRASSGVCRISTCDRIGQYRQCICMGLGPGMSPFVGVWKLFG